MIHIGDCREVMRRLISEGVKAQMCVTSPPYWGLRDYGHDGQLGLEKTPEEYVAKMVDVFRLVRELLNDDGVLWLNLGDTYAASGVGGNPAESAHRKQATNAGSLIPGRKPPQGYKQKDLVGIPWMVAFALRNDGWYLRSDIIWHKPNPMPESVTDRPTRSHEYIFLLSKSAKYYYDSDAIKEPCITPIDTKSSQTFGAAGGKAEKVYGKKVSGKKWTPKMGGGGSSFEGHSGGFKADGTPMYGSVRNKRSVWTVTTKPYAEAHFATYPPELIEPCILAGSKVGDTVLDPFFGSGTTGQVSEMLGRKWIGIELNPEYEKLQKDRTAQRGMQL